MLIYIKKIFCKLNTQKAKDWNEFNGVSRKLWVRVKDSRFKNKRLKLRRNEMRDLRNVFGNIKKKIENFPQIEG